MTSRPFAVLASNEPKSEFLKGSLWGITLGVIKGDTRSLDCGSLRFNCPPQSGLRVDGGYIESM